MKKISIKNILIPALVLMLGGIGLTLLAQSVGPSISIDTINGQSGPFDFNCLTNPLFNPVTVTGNGTGEAPPGQIDQYHVQIDWGDGMVTNDLGIFNPATGQGVFAYTFNGGPHSYSSGNYTITARLYHSQPPGQDNQADTVISVPICVVSEPPILTVIKQVINDGIGLLSASDFSIYVKAGDQDVNGSPAAGSEIGTEYTLAPGTYTISEDPESDYTQSFSGDCDSVGVVSLGSGDVKTCTLTNDDEDPECTTNLDCDDDNACNGTETCEENTCQPGTPLVCDDQNPCTDNGCNSEFGCIYENNTDPCDDGDACTIEDVCAQGMCLAGFPLVCDDQDICTDDSCNSFSGCIFTPNGQCGPECEVDEDCDNGLACDGLETCVDDECIAGTAVDCYPFDIPEVASCGWSPDDNPFTWDFRALFSSTCVEPTGTCSTGDETITHNCDSECGGCEEDADCNDDNENTTDACNLETCACEHTPIEQPYCGDYITNGEEECDNGSANGQACSPGCESTCSYCTNDCTTATLTGDSCGGGGGGGGGVTRYCGDGLLTKSIGEECDDGNKVDGDGCSSTCKTEETEGEVLGEAIETEVLGADTTLPETGQDPFWFIIVI